MAVTNKQIIVDFKAMNNIPLDEPLNTYAVWKSLGYKVKKGEHAKYEVSMWKHTNRKVTDDDGKAVESNHCYMTKTHLFTKEQVEKI
jgi:hypothetical protein